VTTDVSGDNARLPPSDDEAVAAVVVGLDEDDDAEPIRYFDAIGNPDLGVPDVPVQTIDFF
jgi:hypothetical protein